MGFWQSAGKPDFARCAEFISRFDPDLRESLSRSEGKVLQWILFYAWRAGAAAPQAGNYISFSQAKVGEKFARSRWTVARALDGLSSRGLISSLRRRPSSTGEYCTNLYFLGAKLKAILARLLSRGGKILPCAQLPHKNSKEDSKAGALHLGLRAASENKEENSGNDAGNEKLRAWAERWGVDLSGNRVPA